MERKRKFTLPDGSDVDAVEVGFREGGEHFNEYLLDDGTVVRFKAVVTSVQRLEGLYDADGNPAYVVNSSNIVVVSAPDDLRKEGNH